MEMSCGKIYKKKRAKQEIKMIFAEQKAEYEEELQEEKRKLEAKFKHSFDFHDLRSSFEEIKMIDADQKAASEEELQEEKRKLETKLTSQERKVDYLERAKRLEEILLLQKSMEEQQERRLAAATRERLQRIKPDKEAFLDKFKSEWNFIYEEKLREFEKVLKEERNKRLAQRKIAREEERRQKYIREKKQEAERKREEEIRREEKERRKKEKEEKKERLRAEHEDQEKKKKDHLAMMERVAAKHCHREEDIERRLQEDCESSLEHTSVECRRGQAAERGEHGEDRSERGEDRPGKGKETVEHDGEKTECDGERTEREERKKSGKRDKPREELSSSMKAGSEEASKNAEPWKETRDPPANEEDGTWQVVNRRR